MAKHKHNKKVSTSKKEKCVIMPTMQDIGRITILNLLPFNLYIKIICTMKKIGSDSILFQILYTLWLTLKKIMIWLKLSNIYLSDISATSSQANP